MHARRRHRRRAPAGEADVKIVRLGSKDDVSTVRPTQVSSRVYKVFSTLFTAAKEGAIAPRFGLMYMALAIGTVIQYHGSSHGNDWCHVFSLMVSNCHLLMMAKQMPWVKEEQVAVQNGSVAWKYIQTAFAHPDFTLLKTCGSAWTFRHPNDRRTVTVHEPHPEPTMRFWEARRFRRRLTMASFMLNPKMA
ncbi:hypothetical protein DFH09DRAFT_165374 [Mycena vulgaris]|nr:hypothetical protein DFH09DRAFT_165374 [Mycena vulgaris]